MSAFQTVLAVLGFLLAALALRAAKRNARALKALDAAFQDVRTQLLDSHLITRLGGLRNLPQGGEEGTDPDKPKG